MIDANPKWLRKQSRIPDIGPVTFTARELPLVAPLMRQDFASNVSLSVMSLAYADSLFGEHGFSDEEAASLLSKIAVVQHADCQRA